MSEVLPIEAIRAATPVDPALAAASAPSAVADPSAVAKFEAAMAAPPRRGPRRRRSPPLRLRGHRRLARPPS